MMNGKGPDEKELAEVRAVVADHQAMAARLVANPEAMLEELGGGNY